MARQSVLTWNTSFKSFLSTSYQYARGSSAKGIDFPDLNVDVKVTSIKQPQSSCPYSSARQKIYGLGYALFLFVYEKHDDITTELSRLDILHTIYINAERTADYQLTSILRETIANQGNRDDVIAILQDRNLPVEEIALNNLADEIMIKTPLQGYLTISNALQWRLQYNRVVSLAGKVEGLKRLR